MRKCDSDSDGPGKLVLCTGVGGSNLRTDGIYICIYTYIYVYIHVYMQKGLHTYIWMDGYIRICVCVCVCVLRYSICTEEGIQPICST